MNDRMKILKEVAIRADLFYDDAKKLGKVAKEAFSDRHKSQIKGLENIANSALKVSEVLDYIKRQTGRAETGKGWKKYAFGKNLLEKIETGLKQDRDFIVSPDRLNVTSDEQKLEIYLLLIREFIRQMVVHYEYALGENG